MSETLIVDPQEAGQRGNGKEASDLQDFPAQPLPENNGVEVVSDAISANNDLIDGRYVAIEEKEYSNGVRHIYGVDAATDKKTHLSYGKVAALYGHEVKPVPAQIPDAAHSRPAAEAVVAVSGATEATPHGRPKRLQSSPENRTWIGRGNNSTEENSAVSPSTPEEKNKKRLDEVREALHAEGQQLLWQAKIAKARGDDEGYAEAIGSLYFNYKQLWQTAEEWNKEAFDKGWQKLEQASRKYSVADVGKRRVVEALNDKFEQIADRYDDARLHQDDQLATRLRRRAADTVLALKHIEGGWSVRNRSRAEELMSFDLSPEAIEPSNQPEPRQTVRSRLTALFADYRRRNKNQVAAVAADESDTGQSGDVEGADISERDRRERKYIRRVVGVTVAALAGLTVAGLVSNGGGNETGIPASIGEDKNGAEQEGPVHDAGAGNSGESSLNNGEHGAETLPFAIERGHGYTQEIKDSFPGFSAVQYRDANRAALQAFGQEYLHGVAKYRMPDGELGLAHTGTGNWAPGVEGFLQDYFTNLRR